MSKSAKLIKSNETINVIDIISGKVRYTKGDRFHCPDESCNAVMILKAASSEKGISAYFAALKSKPHRDHCPAKSKLNDKNEESYDILGNKIPNFCINRLVINNEAITKPNNINEKKESIISDEMPTENETKFSKSCSGSLIDVVVWYISNYKQGVGKYKLNVPGIEYKNYRSVFQQISFPHGRVKFNKHIFYSQINLYEKYSEIKEGFNVPINIWNEGKRSVGNVIIHTDSWNKEEYNHFKNAFNKVTKAQYIAYKDSIKKNLKSDLFTYIFFIGIQDEDNFKLFHVKNPKTFCFQIMSNKYYLGSKNLYKKQHETTFKKPKPIIRKVIHEEKIFEEVKPPQTICNEVENVVLSNVVIEQDNNKKKNQTIFQKIMKLFGNS